MGTSALEMLGLNSTAPPEGSPPVRPGKEQQEAGLGILLQIMMLVLSFVLGHVLRRHRFYYVPEASASLLIGLIVGMLANVSNTETSFRTWFNFHEEFFFLFLLPPIILYPNDNNSFSFSDITITSSIITFAILGTFIASIVTGVLVYLGGLAFLMYRLPLVECLMFGSLISATDPVTVLSIFQELGTDVNLYALVFGESVLNDAMAISLYRTMALVRSHASSGHNFLGIILKFLETFLGSMGSGIGVGFVSSLISFRSALHLFKYAGLDVDNLQNLECCLFVLFPYFSYMLAEGSGLSGIVSILFTGIVMKRYTSTNLSEKSQHFATGFFHLISSLAETFVAANVFSCAYIVNMVRPANRRIPIQHQKALWYSGLRGAMAFALALQSAHDLPEGHGQTIFTATTAIVVLTVLLIGGSTGPMLEALEVVGDGPDGSHEDTFEGNNGYIAPTYEEGSSSGSRLKMRLKEFTRPSFTALDKNYLTPFFTTQNDDEEEADEPPPSSQRGRR
ncbi:unnamed protein product [Spirodela intermedia]|uniref:Cation/H+ exchanger transmembrane domain-containing protein n=1 Tax=Spirodela intermedia TaxID=51605 RepID=A0A7I8LHN5_SPIIN|nr:unnamed protein product [Spirodela intermedia]